MSKPDWVLTISVWPNGDRRMTLDHGNGLTTILHIRADDVVADAGKLFRSMFWR